MQARRAVLNAKMSDYHEFELQYGVRRKFLNVPISMKFEHTLSAGSPKITENYHIKSYRSATNKDITCEIVAGLRQRHFFFVLDNALVQQSRLTTAESAMLLLNNRIADIIRENKKILYAELMQWANQSNFWGGKIKCLQFVSHGAMIQISNLNEVQDENINRNQKHIRLGGKPGFCD